MVTTSFVKIVASPENRKEIQKTLNSLVSAIRIQPGCEGCYCGQNLENENTIFLFEEWQTETDLKRHLRSAQYKKVLALMDMSLEPPDIKFNTVSASRGIEVVIAAREQAK